MMLADRTGVGVLNKNVVKGRMLHDPALCVQSSGQAHRGREESVVTRVLQGSGPGAVLVSITQDK